ncbi:MAG TPA: hypothetical protein DG753_10270 [Clostridium sp.]|nr:hypothetical protein [Clostridium sp.]
MKKIKECIKKIELSRNTNVIMLIIVGTMSMGLIYPLMSETVGDDINSYLKAVALVFPIYHYKMALSWYFIHEIDDTDLDADSADLAEISRVAMPVGAFIFFSAFDKIGMYKIIWMTLGVLGIIVAVVIDCYLYLKYCAGKIDMNDDYFDIY